MSILQTLTLTLSEGYFVIILGTYIQRYSVKVLYMQCLRTEFFQYLNQTLFLKKINVLIKKNLVEINTSKMAMSGLIP